MVNSYNLAQSPTIHPSIFFLFIKTGKKPLKAIKKREKMQKKIFITGSEYPVVGDFSSVSSYQLADNDNSS